MNPSEAVTVGRMTSTPILIHEDVEPSVRLSQSVKFASMLYLHPSLGGIYRIGRKHGSPS